MEQEKKKGLQELELELELELEDTARYAGLLLVPVEGFGLRPRLLMLFWLTSDHFWCSVGPSVTFSSNLRKLKIQIIQKKYQKYKISKNLKNLKNPKKKNPYKSIQKPK